MPSKTDQAWFAGLVDGEGCFTFSWQRTLHLAFILGMTHERTIQRASVILEHAGVPQTMKIRAKSAADKPEWKTFYEIRVQNFDGVLRVCEFIRPFSVTKFQYAEEFADVIRQIQRTPVGNRSESLRGPVHETAYQRLMKSFRPQIESEGE
jgi:hypothetical protein